MAFPFDINEENYLSLRKAYRQAVKDKKEDFTWNEHGLVTNFAKYVLEYMEMNPIIKPLMDKPDPE